MKRTDRYAPIGSYALLGDGRGAALVASDGAVDWLAAPNVDSPPLCAALLDPADGGRVQVAPVEEHTVSRRYLEGTMVLETTFTTEAGTLTVTDALTLGQRGPLPWTELARDLQVRGGPMRVRYEVAPGNRFARARPWAHERDGSHLILDGDVLCALVTEHLGTPSSNGSAFRGEAVLEAGTHALLALVVSDRGPLFVPRPEEVRRRIDHTIASWRAWSSLICYDGPFAEQVVRSALVVKSLQNAATGALVAAPTTSLPEVIGGERNFDYRFGWVRDGAFMLDALSRLGLSEDVDASLSWLLAGVRRTAPDIHVFYTLDARPAPATKEAVEQYAGYRASRPVMLGNKAAGQTQHGAYGDLIEAVARYVGQGGKLDTETGLLLAQLIDAICDEWPRPGAGIWELGSERIYTSSLINCWAAFDRGSALAERGELPAIHLERWRRARDDVRTYIDAHCWSDAKGTYTFAAGTEDLDASVLLAARTGFLAGDDRRLWSTIDAIRRELTADGPLLFRYSGAGAQEHAFICCTFWAVEALAHARRLEEAGELLEGMLACGNDVGLFSEEIDARSHELLGNFPLGLSHLALIGAVTAYCEASRSTRRRAA